MRKVRILKLELENFKGLPCFSVQFDDRLTQVVGSNGVGKTTLHDAYLWLLLGIDSANRAAFAVQPLDENGKTVNHLTTSVTGTFSFDGTTHVLKRSLHQTWTRRRGTKEDVLTGNETEYFVDNVPYKASEFSSWVTKMFCPVEDFKLVSSLRAFGQLDMKSKRRKLIQMAGAMPELINPTDYPRLSVYYETVKNVEAIRKQVKYEMDGLKTKQAAIPIKITENERDMPTGIDFDDLRRQVAEKEAECEKIDARLQKDAESKSGLFSEAEALNNELKAVNAELLEIETQLASQRTRRMAEVSEKVSALGAKLRDITNTNRGLLRDAEDLEGRINNAEERKKELGRQWVAKNSETFPDGVVTECPTCHRPFDEEDIVKARNEAVRAFNAGKVAVLSRIEQEGDEIVKKIAKYREELDNVNALLENGNVAVRKATEEYEEAKRQIDEVPTLENLKEFNKEYRNVLAKKNELTARVLSQTPREDSDTISLKNRKETLKAEIASLYKQIGREADIAKVEARRNELERENTELATKIGELDGVLYEIMCYQKAYIELVERQVSSMFKLVTWKMYSKNITNDGETEICECLVDGVPVSTNVNTAGAVNAGIDIVNAISKWLEVSFPLWIDGKESVVELIDTDAQVITLKVVENSELKVL